MLSDYDMGELEIHCYSTVLPRVQALLQSIGDTTKLAAKCFKVSSSTRPRYMIFDDLSSHSFRNADRRIGLDMQHMELVVGRMAKWHATTAHLGEIDPEMYGRRTVRPITLEPKPFDAFFVNSMESCAEEVRKWSGCEVYGDKLKKLSKTILNKSFHAYDRDETGFNCLTHSDLWMNNIMFKYNASAHPLRILIPLRLVEDGTHADLSGLVGDEPDKVAFRKQLFSHPKYRSFMEPILKFCYNKGILES